MYHNFETMPFIESEQVPSLLVFGPQTQLPTWDTLSPLRQEIVTNNRLSDLRIAVKHLPEFWKTLTSFDRSLSRVPGTRYLTQIQLWIEHGGGLTDHSTGDLSNIYAFPLTFLIQILQYSRYLSKIGGEDLHKSVLENV